MHMKNDPDVLDRLLKEIANGSKTALAELYDGTKAAVYAYAMSVLRAPEDAEDALQDVFLDVWQSAGMYKSVGKPMGWIIAIAKNRCYMKLRQERRRAAEPFDPERFAEKAANVLSPEESAIIRCTLGELDPDERRIIVLHAVAGLKHREIAEILGLSLPAVLSRYNRTVKKLKKTLLEKE